MAKKLTSSKAKEILHDKSVHGHPLTDKQRRFFGAIAGGAPIKAESGSWLDKYDDGGPVQDNYNNASVSLPDGFVGMGYNTQGRNYSPAWGGQFQKGGKLTFLEPTSSKLPIGYPGRPIPASSEVAISVGGENGEPAFLIPSFKYGHPLEDPRGEFRKTGEHLGGPFKTWQEADEWERTVRHPYVEKGQDIPTPIKRWGKDFAMGGSLPGATGFMYARTAGAAPSNGPYAKKTKASAENGKEMSYYQHGLDWKPKNISRNGSDVPKNQNAEYILPSESTALAKPKFTEAQYAEQLNEKNKRKEFEKYITSQPQIKQGKKEISNTTDDSGRSFWETASQFIPVYETYLDVKDIIQGAFTGDTEMKNRGIIGLGAPLSGKAVMGGLDYFTEKTQGKETADYYEQARKDIINRGPAFTKALFKKYGWGGYDKWVADGKPHLDPVYKQGGIVKAQKGNELTPIKRMSLDEQMANLRANQQRTSDAPSVNLAESEKRRLAEARQKADAKRTFISQGRQETPQEKAKNQRLREQYQLLHPNTEINPYTGELQTINPDRGFEGQPLTPGAKRFDKGLEHIMTGLEAAGYAEGLGALGKAGYNAAREAIGQSMESGLLSNAWKLNPWSYQRNLPKNTVWRGLGETGLNDARQSGFLNPRNTEAFGNELYVSPDFKVAENYAKGREIFRGKEMSGPKYIAEIPNTAATFKDTYPGLIPEGSNYVPYEMITTEKIPIDNVKFLKEHWLRGYKEVPKPTSGSSYPSFKSITGNPEYIDQEHLAGLIKKETDWLRSPEYIKRKMAATGKSENSIKKESEKIINNINKTSIEYTGKAEDWASGLYSPGKNPKISIFNSEVDYPYYEGVLRHEVGHAFSEMANPGDELVRFLKNEGYRNYPKVNLNKTTKDKISSIFENSWANLAPEQQVTGRRMMDIIEETQGLKRGTELSEQNVKKLIDHLKSDKFNTGDNDVVEVMSKFKRKFGEGYSKQLTDFLNKAYAIPGIGIAGAAALSEGEEPTKQKKGGVIKDDRGQWAHPGEITEIGSNRITMQGVPYPVLGISDEGDQQMMYPEQEYKFKGKKVTEYPMKKANSGWLDKYN